MLGVNKLVRRTGLMQVDLVFDWFCACFGSVFDAMAGFKVLKSHFSISKDLTAVCLRNNAL